MYRRYDPTALNKSGNGSRVDESECMHEQCCRAVVSVASSVTQHSLFVLEAMTLGSDAWGNEGEEVSMAVLGDLVAP